jgi:hypothetical protein
MGDLKEIATAADGAGGSSRSSLAVQGRARGSESRFRRGAPAMRIRAKLGRRLGDIAGTACVVAALALLSPGVRTGRADDETLMSVDPALVAAAERAARSSDPMATPPPAFPAPALAAVPSPTPTAVPSAAAAYPFVPAEDVRNANRPGVPGIEIEPGVVVLNTRGFNYGPPPTPLSPEALRQESAPR